MRRNALQIVVFASIASASLAQVNPPGIVRGTLLAGVNPENRLTVQTAAGIRYNFRFDAATWMERDGERASSGSLKKGEILEIVCDRVVAVERYARIIHIATFSSQPRQRRVAYREDPVEFTAPRGDLTFAGIVTEIGQDKIAIRTRIDGLRQFSLRGDTRFLASGSAVEPAALHPNTRIFLRAGRNLDGDLEVYTIIWGEILNPSVP